MSTEALGVCRTCMWKITESHRLVDLDAVMKTKDYTLQVRDQLRSCVPELNLDAKFSSVICSDCAVALDFLYKFRLKCLTTEKHFNSKRTEGTQTKRKYDKLGKSSDVAVIIGVNAETLQKQKEPRLELVDSNLVVLNDDSLNVIQIEEESVSTTSEANSIDVEVKKQNSNVSNDIEMIVPAYAIENDRNIEISQPEEATNSNSSTVVNGRFNLKVTNVNAGPTKVLKLRYKCKNCEFMTFDKSDIVNHVQIHKDGSNKYFKCEQCNCNMLVFKEVIEHYSNYHHRDMYTRVIYSFSNKAITCFICIDCGELLKTQYMLKKHKKKQHPIKKQKQVVVSNVVIVD